MHWGLRALFFLAGLFVLGALAGAWLRIRALSPPIEYELELTVRRADTGEVLRNAWVFVEPIELTTYTNHQGRATVRVPVGMSASVSLCPTVPEVGCKTFELGARTDPGRVEAAYELPVDPDLAVRVAFVDASTGEPVPGVRVQAIDWKGRNAKIAAPSGELLDASEMEASAEGRLELKVCSWRITVLVFTAEGYAQELIDTGFVHEDSKEWRTVPLNPGGALYVTIQDSSGLDVSPALVTCSRARRSDPRNYEWSARPDSTGTFVLEDLPLRTELAVRLQLADGGEVEYPEPVSIWADDPARIEIELTGRPRVLGRLVAPDGAPLPGRAIWLVRSGRTSRSLLDPEDGPTMVTETDEAGTFTFRHVPAGRWLAGPAPSCTKPEHRESECLVPLGSPVVMESGGETVEVEVLGMSGEHVRGRVQGASGVPVAKAEVTFRLSRRDLSVPDARTDGTGAFRSIALPALDCRVNARESDSTGGRARSEQLEVTPGEFVELTLGP